MIFEFNLFYVKSGLSVLILQSIFAEKVANQQNTYHCFDPNTRNSSPDLEAPVERSVPENSLSGTNRLVLRSSSAKSSP
jgi:hypothetical protein